MLGLKTSEIVIVLAIVALVILPRNLPGLLRALGRLSGWARRSL